MSMTDEEITTYLSELRFPGESLLSRVKLRYRSAICPFLPLLETIKPGSSICDIGCGEGIFLLLCARFLQPSGLAGVDVDPNALTRAAIRMKSGFADARIALITSQDPPDWVFQCDNVTMIDVLHHIPKDSQHTFVRTILDKMNSGSTFIIKDICRSRIPWVYFNKLHDLAIAGEMGRERSRFEIGEWLSGYGSKISVVAEGEERRIVYPHFWYAVRKN